MPVEQAKSSNRLPSGKLSHNYGKSPFLTGKLTISKSIFNSYVKLPQGTAGCVAQIPALSYVRIYLAKTGP